VQFVLVSEERPKWSRIYGRQMEEGNLGSFEL
jgi:hypothetical protein